MDARKIFWNRLGPFVVLGVLTLAAPFIVYHQQSKTVTQVDGAVLGDQRLCDSGQRPTYTCTIPTSIRPPQRPEPPVEETDEAFEKYMRQLEAYKKEYKLYVEKVREYRKTCDWKCTPVALPSKVEKPRPSITLYPKPSTVITKSPTRCPLRIECPLNCVQTKMPQGCDVCKCGDM